MTLIVIDYCTMHSPVNNALSDNMEKVDSLSDTD